MNATLERRTTAQGEAILAGIKYLQRINNHNFSMNITLWCSKSEGLIEKSTVCGCMAGNLLLAKVPGDKIQANEGQVAMIDAANLIGLTEDERTKLFKPELEWACWDETRERSPMYISRHHAMLVLCYFYLTGIIEWRQEKVYCWLFDHDQNKISGIFK